MSRKLRIAIFAVAALVVAVVAWNEIWFNKGYAPEQPLQFSHKIHAGDNHIPCLYCHTNAERSRHATVPAESVCMNCHALMAVQTVEIEKLRESVLQQRAIHWVKVHDLPDFVHFDHSRHVRASVACTSCHGPVERMDRIDQRMPLTMGWCLSCHDARGVGERGERTDCVRCHY